MRVVDGYAKNSDSQGKGWKVLYNWILPALIFIVLIAVGFHTFLIATRGY